MYRQPLTLLQMQGASDHPAQLDDAVLVLIDLQEEYRTGALPLPDVEPMVAEAAKLLTLARNWGVPVTHVMHEVGGEAPIFNPGLPSFRLMGEVEARGEEARVVKRLPNAFAGTDLDARLRATGRSEIIVVGAMTHMCVSATVRAALDHGYRSTVVADACATRDLPSSQGDTISAGEVHRTALAELADAFAIVVPNTSAWNWMT